MELLLASNGFFSNNAQNGRALTFKASVDVNGTTYTSGVFTTGSLYLKKSSTSGFIAIYCGNTILGNFPTP